MSANFYELLKAGALCGKGKGSGSGVENYITSEVEIGTIDVNGDNADNVNRLRTKDFTVLGAGTYSIYYTSELEVVCFRYAADGTFIERLNYGYFESAPITFTALEGQQFRFVFNSISGTIPLSPEDIKNLVLFKN